MENIFFVNEGYTPNSINPITNSNFNSQWIFLEILDTNKFNIFSGGNPYVFRIAISKQSEEWPYRVMDFIDYELSHSKKILISINKDDYLFAKQIYENHSYVDPFLRKYEKPILVHSTSKHAYSKILNQKKLKSWNLLKRESLINECKPIGSKLGDPLDYSDYIMFTNGGVMGEIIVNSKQLGYIEMSKNMKYKAGARFYFDAKKIANDKKLIRDGAHLKVYESLDLNKYLIWTATPKVLNLHVNSITPAIFSSEADRMFEKIHKIKLD